MIYAFSLYSVLTKEKFSIQPFALKTAHLFCHFARISVYRTHADIGLSKRSKNNSSEKERFNIAKPGGPRMTGMMNLNLNSTTGTPRTTINKAVDGSYGKCIPSVYHNQRIVLYYSLLEVCEDQGLIDH